jgi:hypothetical protein
MAIPRKLGNSGLNLGSRVSLHAGSIVSPFTSRTNKQNTLIENNNLFFFYDAN